MMILWGQVPKYVNFYKLLSGDNVINMHTLQKDREKFENVNNFTMQNSKSNIP
jgi:hypothetical protein